MAVALPLLLIVLWQPGVLAQSHKPLPPKKNPELVGRRDINRRQINFYSLEQEMALGRQLAAQIEMQVPLVRDPVITEYVNRIGQNLALNSDVKVPLTVKVIASDDINAFALPGGFLYVNLGILRLAESESELAGVIAHEIAHIAARHALENLSKQNLIALGTIPLIFVGGPVGDLAREGAGFGLTALFFKFSRGAEKEADELGAQYMWATGYDPWHLISFFEKMQRRQREIPISPLFRSHPATPERIKNARQLIARFPERNDLAANTREFDDLKSRFVGGAVARPRDAGRGDPSERRPPVLTRRTDDEPSADESADSRSSPPGGNSAGRTPPRIIDRTAPGSSAGEDASSASDRRPPRLIDRTAPDRQSEASASRSPDGMVREDRLPVIIIPNLPTEPLNTKPLPRTPPKLRRRY